MKTGKARITSLPKHKFAFFFDKIFVLSLSEFKMRIRRKRLVEIARTGLERGKRPPHNFNFRHFTLLFPKGRQRKNEKCEKCRNDRVCSLNCLIYGVLVTIVTAKAPPYCPLLCVAS